jgi:Flp pilus assembly protein TadG
MISPTPGREGGNVGMMFVGSLFAIFGFCGLALELSQVYNRKMEMQSAADTVALAAALELNGTAAGVTKALQKVAERFSGPPGGLTYRYSNSAMAWSDAAIKFGSSPDGPWVDAGTAASNPNGLLYAKVDTADLDSTYGEVNTVFMQALSAALATVSTSAQAIAGRSAIKVTPLGLCVMRPEAGRNHNATGELEEYGFRRGVSYDLMQLNPGPGTSAGLTYLINPQAPPGSAGPAPSSDATTVAPFVCTGTMAMARVTGGPLTVSSPFPLVDLFSQLNSRFGTYSAPCNAYSAPPDANVKAYTFNGGNVPWMNAAPTVQAAALTIDTKRWTIVGPDTTPAGTLAGAYGPLWSYAKAAKFSSYVPGVPEPSGGYSTFSTSDWQTLLYTVGQPKASAGYPATTPYAGSGGANFLAPPGGLKGVRDRRVLNVPLLACPVSGSSATVLGIGKFFMTVPATSTTLYAEFAGLVPEQSLGIRLELFK